MPDQFKERKALITGGTSGIGLAIAKALADEGVQVIAAGLNAVDSVHDNIRVVELDVTDDIALQQLIKDCGEDFVYRNLLKKNVGNLQSYKKFKDKFFDNPKF